MGFDIHVYFHNQSDGVLEAVAQLKESLMAILDPLAAEVTETKTVIQSAIVLINGLANQLQEHLNEPEKIQEIIDSLRSDKQALAEAVAENTPQP